MSAIITYSRNGTGSVPGVSKAMKQEHEVMRVRRGGATEPCDLLIRWASRVCWPSSVDKTINLSRAIGAASNKAHARLALQGEGVSVPKTSLLVPAALEEEWTFPVVVRPHEHQGGRDFGMLTNLESLQRLLVGLRGDWYISEFYPKTHEYRVHVAHGRVLLVNEKRPREGQEHKREEPVWNHATNDFEFVVLRWRDLPVPSMRVAIQATEALGLDYAGVDVMAGAPDAEPAVVCEVNCSPTLEDYSALQYAVYFDWLIETGGKEDHFPMPEDGVHPQTYIFRQEVGRT